MSDVLLVVHNGQAVPRSRVPVLGWAAFHRAIVDAPVRGRRVSALFGHVDGDGPLQLYAVLSADDEGLVEIAATRVEGASFPSLTRECPEVHLFEREIAEQWGVRPDGHPWLKPVRFVRSERPGHDAWSRPDEERPLVGVTDFYRVAGDEIHEVGVGPVHAGVIEPGHFRFQCDGEHVFHLEIALGYQHRGVERAMVGAPHKRAIHYMETLAGDTSVGHALAYAQLVEGLAGARATPRSQVLRGIALELERLANHTGDLGALAGDVGFLPTASYCGRLRGEYLNLTALLCGNRFGRGLVRPGGVACDVDGDRAREMTQRLDGARRDVEEAAGMLWSTASVQARFEDTGTVARDTARSLGLVGVAARACGLRRDVRRSHPSGIYQFVHVPTATWHSGDVFARAFVRWLEIQRASEFVRAQLAALPSSATRNPVAAPAADAICVSLVEGWRGELCHVALTDGAGRFARYKIVDPSFHNWIGLALALRDQQISDFPLCNKSFNLSYCGFDL